MGGWGLLAEPRFEPGTSPSPVQCLISARHIKDTLASFAQFIWIPAYCSSCRCLRDHRHGGLVVKASASRGGGRGFDPWPSHT